jgi:uncharacterized protein (TIGR02145 family)
MTGSTTYKNLCPTGYHVPTATEWATLTNHLGGVVDAGGKMKETGTTFWNTDPGSTNSSGFTALPGGSRRVDDGFQGIRGTAFFWSATENSLNALGRILLEGDGIMRGFNGSKKFGGSVRCLED